MRLYGWGDSLMRKFKLVGVVCVMLLWQGLTACTPEPTVTPSPKPAAQVEPTAAISPTTQAPASAATRAPTAVATLTLSANAEQELDVIRSAARDAQGGFLFYLDAPGRTNNPQVLEVADKKAFEAVAVAGNYGVKDHEFALVCLVDYTQSPCQPGSGEKTLRFHLDASQETRLGVNLALDAGTHDVVFLTFYDPGDHSTEQAFRQDSRFLFSFHRVQVIVGGVKTRPSPPVAQSFSTAAGMQAGAGIFTISRDKFTDPLQAPWHSETSAAGAPLNFFAVYSNPEEVTRTVALMAFLDFEQVPWDATQTTFFAELNGGARADVPAQIAVPNVPGEHELVVVAVDNPFLDLAGQVEGSEPRSFFADSSDRVLITVR